MVVSVRTRQQRRNMEDVKHYHGYPSICIPRTFPNTTWRDVRDIFEGVMGRGCVERVDVVNKTNRRGQLYRCVFIHLKEWPETEVALQVRERLLQGEEIKLVYDDPWFWKCTVSRLPKPAPSNASTTLADRGRWRGSDSRDRDRDIVSARARDLKAVNRAFR